MIDQTFGDKTGGYEIGSCSNLLESLSCFTTDSRNFEACGESAEASMLFLESLFNGMNTIAAGKHQPVKAIEVCKGIV